MCLPFVGHLMRNRKDVNRISFLNRGYAFKGLLAVIQVKVSNGHELVQPDSIPHLKSQVENN